MQGRRRLKFGTLMAAMSVLAVTACGSDGGDGSGLASGSEPGEDSTSTSEPVEDSTSASGDSTSASGSVAIDASACPPEATEPITGDTIELASSGPQSGPFASVGLINQGAKAYFDWLNENEGGVETVEGKKEVNVTIYDDQFEPSQTQANIREAIQRDGAVATIAVTGLAHTRSALPFLEQQCVPSLFPATANDELAQNPWVKQIVSYKDQSIALGRHIAETTPDATIAVLTRNDADGQASLEGLKEGLEGSNAEVIAEQTYELTDTTVASQMTTLAASGATDLYVVASAVACTQALSELENSGWEPKVWIAELCSDTAVAQSTGDAKLNSSRVYYYQPMEADTPGMEQYREVMAAAGLDHSLPSLIGYSYAQLAEATFESAQELTSVGIGEAVHNLPSEPPSPSPFVEGTAFDAEVGRVLFSEYRFSDWDPDTNSYGANLTEPIPVS